MEHMSVIALRAAVAFATVALAAGCAAPVTPPSTGPGATASATTSPTEPPASVAATSAAPTTVAETPSPSSSTATSPGEDLVVVINGVEYTCSQMFSPSGEACPAEIQERWARWSGGMQTYLDSEELTTTREALLPPLSTQQLLAFGFTACVMAEDSPGKVAEASFAFLEFVREGRPDADEDAVTEMYFAALQYLCEDVPLE